MSPGASISVPRGRGDGAAAEVVAFDEPRLTQRARAGERDAFGQLYRLGDSGDQDGGSDDGSGEHGTADASDDHGPRSDDEGEGGGGEQSGGDEGGGDHGDEDRPAEAETRSSRVHLGRFGR